MSRSSTPALPCHGPAPRPADSAALLLQAPLHDELGPAARRWLTGGVLAAHVMGAWGLLQIEAVQQAVVHTAPLMLRLITPVAPSASLSAAPTPAAAPSPNPAAATPPPPARPAPPRPAVPAPLPLIAAAPTPAAPTPSRVVAQPTPWPEPTSAPAAVAEASAPITSSTSRMSNASTTSTTPPATAVSDAPALPPPTLPASPAQPRPIAPGAVRYLAEPRMSVPLLSRRLRESGTVVLRIVVDTRGLLKDAAVSRSSGFARLDAQALLDIRSARFVPQTDNGQPIEWQTLAPMAYETH